MARRFRFWMTGCIAVVAAAMAGARPASASDRHLTSRASRFGVAETIERIEARAQVHGLKLFARLAPPAAAAANRLSSRVTSDGSADGAVIVFESARGGTPVLMDDARSQPDLPLSLIVRRNELGVTEVMLSDADWEGLPADVASDVTQLPQMISEALEG